MTTIIGVQHQWGVEMAADSQVNWGERPVYAFGVDKIINRDGYLIATAGDGRISEIVMYTWKPPRPTFTSDGYNFMVTKVVPSLRKALIDNGWEKGNDNFDIIIAAKGQVFAITSDFSVVRDEEGFYGIGTGGDYAVGALYAGAQVEDAVMIGIKLDINSGGAVQIEKQVK